MLLKDLSFYLALSWLKITPRLGRQHINRPSYFLSKRQFKQSQNPLFAYLSNFTLAQGTGTLNDLIRYAWDLAIIF